MRADGFELPFPEGWSRDVDTGLTDADLLELFERHRPETLRYAMRCVGRREVAEEITNEAFLRLLENRATIESTRAIAWVTTTVKHLAIDHWRHQAIERQNWPGLQSRSHTQSRPDFELSSLLKQPALKAEHRACLLLHYLHGMERKEIASHTGMSENQVKSCLQYGLRLLRKAFR